MAKDVRERPFTTVSGVPIERLYTEESIRELDYKNDLGDPGEPPYTRGIYPTMYQGRLWTIRQFSGFGTAENTNERFRYLLKNGQTGLSVAFHLPTLMGYDSDHPMSEGEVGRCGVAIDSLADMETLFSGIPLDQISTSMTTNAPATILSLSGVQVQFRNRDLRRREDFPLVPYARTPASSWKILGWQDQREARANEAQASPSAGPDLFLQRTTFASMQ